MTEPGTVFVTGSPQSRSQQSSVCTVYDEKTCVGDPFVVNRFYWLAPYFLSSLTASVRFRVIAIESAVLFSLFLA